ncbi:hypothetical protein L1987_24063 [Smallanthus sonchifolius]|uniref:Uncharacterized protein n=1 Tax=Smallanthus sonchifolius TaxID=185202 RepID=A0ACB9IKV9_9ASTR|nr:hypothetical protein L1987_24063 [Smallanthus sonchifolius]
MQNYEFESTGFVDTSTTKPVGAALIAPMVENTSPAPKTSNNFKPNSGSSSQSTAPVSKPAALVSQQTTNGGEGYDWSAHSEKIKQNQALMADVKGKESSEKVSSDKVDNDEIALYKNHNQILVDELNKSLAINTDLKEAKEIHGRVKNGLGYKVVPHPFNGDFKKVDVNHLPNFPLSADPILNTSKPKEKIGSEDERAKSISQNVGEFVLREEVVSDRQNDRDACQFSENDFLYFPKDFKKENISFHVNAKISDESKKVESKGLSSSQNVKT